MAPDRAPWQVTPMPFVLDERLRADTQLLGESDLSLLLLFDDARYPWTVLVPRREGLVELFDLSELDGRALWDESRLLGRAMANAFSPHKLNVGALGNVVRQLHVHHVARSPGDPAWPGPVWGHSPRVPRTPAEQADVTERLFGDTALAAHFQRV